MNQTVFDANKNLIFNEYDREKLNIAISALHDSEFSGFTLLKWIYTVAFSANFSLKGTYAEILEKIFVHGNADTEDIAVSGEEAGSRSVDIIKMAVPGLSGEKAVNSSSECKKVHSPKTSDLISGDVLLIHGDITEADSTKMYIYGSGTLWEFMNTGLCKAETDNILSKLPENDSFIVLRPSRVLENHYPGKAPSDILDENQRAVVETAKAYLMRGGRLQYDDSRFGAYSYGEGAEYRWQYGVSSPEDCTKDEWKYSNCAAFCHDVYRFGLGCDIKHWCTDLLVDDDSGMRVYHCELTGKETEQEQSEIITDFENRLLPGDIIVIKRYKNNSGHAMLYIGDGLIIHSGGSSYNLKEAKETYEPTVRFLSLEKLTTVNDSTVSIFGGLIKRVAIIRPLETWKGIIPQNTVNRVKNLSGISVEKTSSHASFKSVNAGEEITYTLSAYNSNTESVTVEFTDSVPENTSYVSGCFSVNGNGLSKKATIPPCEKVSLSYTVCVNENTAENTLIEGKNGKIGGVSVNCPGIYVKRTLTQKEQEKLLSAISAHKGSPLCGFCLASSIYEDISGGDDIFDKDMSCIEADIFDFIRLNSDDSAIYYSIKASGFSKLSKMIVPGLYGGRRYYTGSKFDYKRTRLARRHNLIPGDIVFARTLNTDIIYLYDGNSFLDLTDGMKEYNVNESFEKFLAYEDFYVALRPSYVLK